ncbi:hypothetical protein NRF20_09525 [Streptomyces sp. R-74717]|uniref:hypothetical protein n=1 Tax=Streptomyces TaxID=1883 RepID=UPI00378803C0
MTSTLTIPRTDLDPYTDLSIADPYPVYSALRDAAPVVFLASHQVHCAARYDEVYSALHRHSTFVSGEGVGLTDALNKAQKGSSFTSDPPYRAYVRGLVARHLKPRAMADITEYVTSWADRLVRELVERGSFDAVRDFAVAFPLAVVPDLLGWPEDEGKERLLQWASAGFNAFGPMNDRTQAGLPLWGEMGDFLHRMSQPGNLRPGSWGAELVSEDREGKIEDKLLPGLLGNDTVIHRLTDALVERCTGLDPEHVADTLLTHLGVSRGASDDIALVVVRLREAAPARATGHPFHAVVRTGVRPSPTRATSMTRKRNVRHALCRSDPEFGFGWCVRCYSRAPGRRCSRRDYAG